MQQPPLPRPAAPAPCRRWRLRPLARASSPPSVALLVLQLGILGTSNGGASKGVDFGKHGGDWRQGHCSSRARQSPIDVSEIYRPPIGDFPYFYTEASGLGTTLKMRNDGRVLSVSTAGLDLGGLSVPVFAGEQWFTLSRIEFHSISEHTSRGAHAPLEVQLVHVPTDGTDPGLGYQYVTVSILVDCVNPPRAEEVWPGLLQLGTDPGVATWKALRSSRLRGSTQGVFARQYQERQERPQLIAEAAELDNSMPAGERPEERDAVPTMVDAEIGFVHSLIVGERAVVGDGRGGGRAGGTAASIAAQIPGLVYNPPPPGEADFNPILQAFLEEEPPELNQESTVAQSNTLRLGPLLAGSKFFAYWGSETLPPCNERVLWLVRHDKIMASRSQVLTLFGQLHKMSGGAGNFRTIMPLNGRPVKVLTSREQNPSRFATPARGTPSSEKDESVLVPIAKDAITIAAAAANYAKDVDLRLRRASSAHFDTLQSEMSTTNASPNVSVQIPGPPLDSIWAAGQIASAVKRGIQQAVERDMHEVGPAVASLAKSYLRQNVLGRAGFRLPPPGAVVTPPQLVPGLPTFMLPANVSQMANGRG